jgi:hypothetical protein
MELGQYIVSRIQISCFVSLNPGGGPDGTLLGSPT